MPRFERVREVVSTPPTSDYLREKAAEGWTLVAIEWEREVEGAARDTGILKEEIPYGLQVAGDCLHLTENPTEKAAMILMLEMIVDDKPLSQVAAELNSQEFRTRSGAEWTQTAVFYMLPRLIEVAPRILSSAEWKVRREVVTGRLEKLLH